MNKKIMFLMILVLVLSACSFPFSVPEPTPIPTATKVVVSDYFPIKCPEGLPSTYSPQVCYQITDNAFGLLLYSDGELVVIGLLVSLDSSESDLDKTVEFTTDAVSGAGWDKEDFISATREMKDKEIGSSVVFGSIRVSTRLSDDQEYLMVLYLHH